MTRATELKLSIGVVATIIVAALSVSATHFLGIAAAESKAQVYTDNKVERLEDQTKDILRKISDQLIVQGKAIVRIETKMED